MTLLRLLRDLDIKLRRSVRQWLRLPKDTPLAYFHADVKDGGLGIPSLSYDMPGRITQRAIRLQNSQDSVVARIAAGPELTERLSKWSEPIYLQGNAMNSGKALRRLSWSQLLTSSVDGRGLNGASAVPYAHAWVTDGSGVSSGHLYIAAINARCNLLPTRHRGGRGQSRSGSVRTCDACGPCQLETLSHISQVCPRTWSPRNRRHNKLVDVLSRFLQRKGFTTLLERKFCTSRGGFKPDIVAWNEQHALVIDVTVTSDNLPSENSAHQGKVEKYSAVREISQFLRETTGLEPLFSALAVNWRGVIAPQSAADLREVGITKRELKLLSLITVEQTALIHRHFYQSTYRVKSNRITS